MPTPRSGRCTLADAGGTDIELLVHQELPGQVEADVEPRAAARTAELTEHIGLNSLDRPQIIDDLGRDRHANHPGALEFDALHRELGHRTVSARSLSSRPRRSRTADVPDQ